MQAAVDDPDGGGILLVGPQGVGKSRLAHEIERRAGGAGRCTAWATATRSAGAVDFGALAHLLPDELAPLASTRPVELLRRADAVLAGLGPATAAPVLLVDDAHLLDDVSAAFLHQVALRRLATLVVTVRRDGLPPDPVTALWKDGLLERHDLGPLSRAATAGLLERVLDGHLDLLSLRRIQQVTAGNPLFLREIVHAALGDGSLARHRGLWQWDGVLSVGDRLVELVRTRLTIEDPQCQPVLELVAWGEPLPAWLAERLAGRVSLEAAERAGFLDRTTSGDGLDGRAGYPVRSGRSGRDDEVLRFTHPIYRAVLRSMMTVGRRRTTCEQLAAGLFEHGGGEGPDRLRIAVWLLEAGTPPDRRSVSFAAAARLALQDDDPQLAERLARAALDGERTDALTVLADALEKQGRHDEVVRLLEQAPVTDPPPALAMARTSNPYWAGGLPPSPDGTGPGGPAVGAAVTLGPLSAAEPGDDASGGEVPATDAWVLFFDSRLAECIGIAQVVLARADATRQAQVWAATAGTSALGLSGRTAEALAVADVGLGAAQSLGEHHPWSYPEVVWARVLALMVAGRVEEARGLVEPAGDTTAAPADGSAQLVGMWLGFRGFVAKLQGDHAAARVSLREAVTLLDRADMYHFVRLWLAELAATLACSGDAQGAREVFDEAVERDTGTNRVFEPWIALDGAWVCAGEGRLSEAVDVALRAADMAVSLGHRAFEVTAAFDVARLGRPELVEERITALVPLVEGRFAPTCRDATRALIRRDAEGLTDCSRRFEALGHDLVAAEMGAAAYALLRAAAAPVPAAHAAERSRRLRSRCPEAVTPLLGLAKDQLALTHREREIAALAAAGRSSPDIARILHISTRTVDNHLGRTYAKLGIAGRADLSAVFDSPDR
jgi:DNA-binding CsgD family transcriptional regulator